MNSDVASLAIEFERRKREMETARVLFSDAEKAFESARDALMETIGLSAPAPRRGRPTKLGMDRFIEAFPTGKNLHMKDIVKVYASHEVSYSSLAQLASRAVKRGLLRRANDGSYRLSALAQQQP